MAEDTFPQGTGGFIQPGIVIDQLAIGPKMKVANFGCGHGYFTVIVAKRVGPDGHVYAIDILKDALEAVETKARLENLANINYVRGNLEKVGGSKMADGEVDKVIMVNILFQSQQKEAIVKEAKRVLKSDGRLVVIDWNPTKGMGPAESGWRLPPDEMKKLVESEGLVYEKDIDAGLFHYGMIFRK